MKTAAKAHPCHGCPHSGEHVIAEAQLEYLENIVMEQAASMERLMAEKTIVVCATCGARLRLTWPREKVAWQVGRCSTCGKQKVPVVPLTAFGQSDRDEGVR